MAKGIVIKDKQCSGTYNTEKQKIEQYEGLCIFQKYSKKRFRSLQIDQLFTYNIFKWPILYEIHYSNVLVAMLANICY